MMVVRIHTHGSGTAGRAIGEPAAIWTMPAPLDRLFCPPSEPAPQALDLLRAQCDQACRCFFALPIAPPGLHVTPMPA